MSIAFAPQSTSTAIGRRIRVMIVDDAVVVRGLFARWVEAEPDLEVVASLRTGREAVSGAPAPPERHGVRFPGPAGAAPGSIV